MVITNCVLTVWGADQPQLIHSSVDNVALSLQLAVEHSIKFVETSAKNSVNVEEAFFTLARDIKAKMDRKLVRITFSSHSYSVLLFLHMFAIPTITFYCPDRPVSELYT